MYSLEIRMNHIALHKSHQIALLKLYVNEIKGIQIVTVESTLHNLISHSIAEFAKISFPIEATNVYRRKET